MIATSGSCTALNLLGAGGPGNQSDTVTVSYTDGTSSTAQVNFAEAPHRLGRARRQRVRHVRATDQRKENEERGLSCGIRHESGYGDDRGHGFPRWAPSLS